MLVAIDNYTYLKGLMEDILDDPQILDGMHVNTLSQLTSCAIEKDDFRVLALISELHTGIPSTDDYLPGWWQSDFYDDITIIQLEHQKNSKEVRWCDVILDDGERLTSQKHQPLLNAFKHWITACDNPLENGGKIIASKCASIKFEKILTLIDVILLNAKALKLSEYHLQKVDDAFWLGVLASIADHGGSIVNSLYNVNHRIKNLLDNVDVPREDIDAFAAKYPHVTRVIPCDEIVLNLKDRVKACCWLHQNRYYAAHTKDKQGHLKPQGVNTILTERIFAGKALKTALNIAPFPELELMPQPCSTEYDALPNNEISSCSTKKSLAVWVKVIKHINVNVDKDNSTNVNPVTSEVSAATIAGLISLRKQGRTKAAT